MIALPTIIYDPWIHPLALLLIGQLAGTFTGLGIAVWWLRRRYRLEFGEDP